MNTRQALTLINSKSRERLDHLHKAYKAKLESGDAVYANNLKGAINSYLTALQDCGVITANQWKMLYIYFTL